VVDKKQGPESPEYVFLLACAWYMQFLAYACVSF